jgi:hypothetical protein
MCGYISKHVENVSVIIKECTNGLGFSVTITSLKIMRCV